MADVEPPPPRSPKDFPVANAVRTRSSGEAPRNDGRNLSERVTDSGQLAERPDRLDAEEAG